MYASDHFVNLTFLRLIAVMVLFIHIYPSAFPNVITTRCPNAYKKLVNHYFPQYCLDCTKKHGTIICDPLIIKNIIKDSDKLYTYQADDLKLLRRINASCDDYSISTIYTDEDNTDAISWDDETLYVTLPDSDEYVDNKTETYTPLK
jgi:hypothetical protein